VIIGVAVLAPPRRPHVGGPRYAARCTRITSPENGSSSVVSPRSESRWGRQIPILGIWLSHTGLPVCLLAGSAGAPDLRGGGDLASLMQAPRPRLALPITKSLEVEVARIRTSRAFAQAKPTSGSNSWFRRRRSGLGSGLRCQLRELRCGRIVQVVRPGPSLGGRRHRGGSRVRAFAAVS